MLHIGSFFGDGNNFKNECFNRNNSKKDWNCPTEVIHPTLVKTKA